MDITKPKRQKKSLHVDPGRRAEQRRYEKERRTRADPRNHSRCITLAGRRRITEDRRMEKAIDRRTKEEQRQRYLARKVVKELERRQLSGAAELVKKGEPIERMLALMSFFVTGVVNYQSLGLLGICFLLVLWYHERGHYLAAKKEGVGASRPLYLPAVGALMGLRESSDPQMARIAYGGPRSGLDLTLVVTALWLIAKYARLPDWSGGVSSFLFSTAFSSLMLNVFNLITLEPIDGGRMAKVMNGRLPQVMRVIGLIVLALLTGFLVFKYNVMTMYIVWILVLDELWLVFGKKLHEVNRFWQTMIGAGILVLVCSWMAIEVTAGRLVGFDLFGDVVYSIFGAYFVRGYYLQWRYPELHPHEEETESLHDEGLGRVMFRNYSTLLAGYASVGLVIWYFA